MDTDALKEKIERARHHGVLPGTVLEVDWSEPPEEPGPGSPLAKLQRSFARSLDLRTTVAAIDRASRDDRVTGLVARVQLDGASISVCQELRAAVRRFRDAGKATTAFGESFGGNAAYYVASAFERVVLLGAGSVGLVGLGSATSFLGEALPNAGIEADFLQRYEYKNMANVFTEVDYTDAHREAVERLIESTLDQLVTDVATDRNLPEAVVRDAFASGPHGAAAALEMGLVDELAFQDEAWASAVGDDGHLLYLERFNHHTAPKKAKTKKLPVVAVVQVNGGIASGRNGVKPGLPPGPGTGSDTFVEGVRAAVADDVAAVVVRVDSPGGSAIASEVMARAITVGREAGVPFVASMASVAASGGYYVSAPCDRIVASPGTVTGSIGVVMGKFITTGLRERIKVATRTIESSDNATIWSGLAPFSDEQREVIDADLDRTYELFLQRVADGRGLSRDEVHEVARGRVWTGSDALDRGLVDALGGFDVALDEARSLAGLDAGAPVRLATYPEASPLDFLNKRENSEPVSARLRAAALAAAAGALGEWERQLQPKGVQARLEGNWRLR